MTLIAFPSESMTCDLPLDDLEAAVHEALAKGVLLTLNASDGRRILINPLQIVYLMPENEPS